MKQVTFFSMLMLCSFYSYAQYYNIGKATDKDSIFSNAWGLSIIDTEEDTMKINVGVGSYSQAIGGTAKSILYNYFSDTNFYMTTRLDGTLGWIMYYPVRGSFIRINDSTLALGTSYSHWNFTLNDYDTVKSGLIFYNNHGDSLYSRWYGEHQQFIVRGMERIGNHIFLLGETKRIGCCWKLYVVKTDLQGNLIWEKTFNQGYIGYGSAATLAPVGNKGYLILGTNYTSDNINTSVNSACLFRIDTAGNFMWYKNIIQGGARGGLYGIRYDSLDGNYFISGCKDTMINATDYHYNTYLAKIDSIGNLQWMHIFNETPHIYKNMWQYRILYNRDIIYCGNRLTAVGTNVYAGYLCKTDEYGNVKWENYYQQNDSSKDNYLCEVKQTPDGGFIAIGVCVDTSKANHYNTWILRVDSNGCLVPGCFPTAVQVYPSEEFHINVYPNPSQGNFTVEYSKPISEKLMLQVFDVTGRKIQIQHIIKGSYKTLVSLQQHTGIYFLQLINEQSKPVFSQKIMIE